MNKLASLFVLASVVFSVACDRSKNQPSQPPTVEPAPESSKVQTPVPTSDALADLFCYKDESEQTYSSEALQSQILFEDEVETKDIETVDCAGRPIHRVHGPERQTTKYFTIEAPDRAADYAQVEVSNQRTCAVVRAKKVSDSALNDEFITSDGKTLRSSPLITQVGAYTGDVKLVVSTDSKLPGALLVMEGMNAVQVRYLDKNGELLATRDILVSLNVKHPEAFGVRRIRSCKE